MSVIWAEGFEHYGAGATPGRVNMLRGLWTELATAVGNGPVTNGTARTGSYYYQLNSTAAFIRRAFGSRTVAGVAFGMRFPNITASTNRIGFRTAGNAYVISIVIMSDGSIQVRSGGGAGTLIYTTDQVLTAGTWHHLEFISTISEIAGVIELRVDGIPVAILDGINLGAEPITQVIWESATSGDMHVDDIVMHTGDGFIGPARVLTVYPDSDGSPFEWDVFGASSGAEAVDEAIPDDDTSYIKAEIPELVAQFLMPTLPIDVEQIVGIHIPMLARQNDAGLTKIQSGFLSGSEAVRGEEHPLTPAYSYVDDAYSVNPDTESGWDKASFEAAILVIERTV